MVRRVYLLTVCVDFQCVDFSTFTCRFGSTIDCHSTDEGKWKRAVDEPCIINLRSRTDTSWLFRHSENISVLQTYVAYILHIIRYLFHKFPPWSSLLYFTFWCPLNKIDFRSPTSLKIWPIIPSIISSIYFHIGLSSCIPFGNHIHSSYVLHLSTVPHLNA